MHFPIHDFSRGQVVVEEGKRDACTIHFPNKYFKYSKASLKLTSYINY